MEGVPTTGTSIFDFPLLLSECQNCTYVSRDSWLMMIIFVYVLYLKVGAYGKRMNYTMACIETL
jgi:hypothetical protein